MKKILIIIMLVLVMGMGACSPSQTELDGMQEEILELQLLQDRNDDNLTDLYEQIIELESENLALELRIIELENGN